MPESWSAKNRRLAREKADRAKAAEAARAAEARGEPRPPGSKRKYTRRGPVCPECGATMDVNPKNGKTHCPFAGSHKTARAVRNRGAEKSGETQRGRAQPPEEQARSRQALAKGRSLWKTRQDPKNGKKG